MSFMEDKMTSSKQTIQLIDQISRIMALYQLKILIIRMIFEKVIQNAQNFAPNFTLYLTKIPILGCSLLSFIDIKLTGNVISYSKNEKYFLLIFVSF